MAAGGLGPDVEAFQEPGHGKADRPYGGLGHVGLSQKFLRFFFSSQMGRGREDVVGEGVVLFIFPLFMEKSLGLVQGLHGFREDGYEIPAHAGILTPLAWKEEGGFSPGRS